MYVTPTPHWMAVLRKRQWLAKKMHSHIAYSFKERRQILDIFPHRSKPNTDGTRFDDPHIQATKTRKCGQDGVRSAIL